MEEDIQTVTVKLSQYAGDLDYLKSLLSPEELDRAGRLCIESKRSRYSLSHGILHLVLGRFLKIGPEEVIIRYDRNGRPFAAGSRMPVRFSLSYSGDYAACSVSGGRTSGVDVQKWGAVRNPLRFARRYFTQEENALLQSTEDSLAPLFYRIWSRKEACAKALGMGRMLPFESLDVRPGLSSPEISITRPGGKIFFLTVTDLNLCRGYSAAAAALKGGASPRFIPEPLGSLKLK